MNKKTIFAISIVVLSGLIGATPYILDETSVDVYQKNYESNISIMPESDNNTSIGINSDRNLDFGHIPEGSNSTKFLNISSKKKSILNINSKGNISEMLEYESKFYFKGVKEVPIEAKGRNPGNYSGNLTLRFEIPEDEVGSYWLDLKYRIYNLR